MAKEIVYTSTQIMFSQNCHEYRQFFPNNFTYILLLNQNPYKAYSDKY